MENDILDEFLPRKLNALANEIDDFTRKSEIVMELRKLISIAYNKKVRNYEKVEYFLNLCIREIEKTNSAESKQLHQEIIAKTIKEFNISMEQDGCTHSLENRIVERLGDHWTMICTVCGEIIVEIEQLGGDFIQKQFTETRNRFIPSTVPPELPFNHAILSEYWETNWINHRLEIKKRFSNFSFDMIDEAFNICCRYHLKLHALRSTPTNLNLLRAVAVLVTARFRRIPLSLEDVAKKFGLSKTLVMHTLDDLIEKLDLPKGLRIPLPLHDKIPLIINALKIPEEYNTDVEFMAQAIYRIYKEKYRVDSTKILAKSIELSLLYYKIDTYSMDQLLYLSNCTRSTFHTVVQLEKPDVEKLFHLLNKNRHLAY
jgi:hypothetical protein